MRYLLLIALLIASSAEAAPPAASKSQADSIRREEDMARLCERAAWLRLSPNGLYPPDAPLLDQTSLDYAGRQLFDSCRRFEKLYGEWPAKCCDRVKVYDPVRDQKAYEARQRLKAAAAGSPERAEACAEFRELTGSRWHCDELAK